MLVTLSGVLIFFGAIFSLFFKKYRKNAQAMVTLGVIIAGFGLYKFSGVLDFEAQQVGYIDDKDRQEAKKSGFTDAISWRQAREKREADERSLQAAKLIEERTLRDRRLAEEAKQKADAEANCQKDLSCWAEKHFAQAVTACRPQVENLAKNDARWTDGMLETKFSHFRWKGLKNDVVTYIGDKIEFQNGLGNWLRHTYECDYAPGRGVVDVRARQGRLAS